MNLSAILPVCVYTCMLFVAGKAKAECPFKCYCANKEVDCSANMDEEFPVFPPDTEKIRLSQLNVRYIPPKTFTDLPNIKKIHITNSNIAEFQSCSISDLNNLTKIIIDKSAIGNIESYAFKNLKNIEELKFEKCRIGRIKPFAFYDISNITMWNMIEVHMRNVYAEAFYEVSNIDHMVLHKNNISDVVTGAFDELGGVKNFEAHENKFWNLQCGNLGMFMSAATDNFFFSQNTFYCNCSIGWLLNNVAKARYGSLLPQNHCHGPDLESTNFDFRGHNLSSIEFSQLNCKRLTQSSIVECKGVEKLVANPKCPKPGQPSVDVIADSKKEKKDNGKNDGVKVQQVNKMFILGVLGIMVLR